MENKISYHWALVDSIVSGKFHMPITCEVDPSNRCMLHCNFCMYKDFIAREAVHLPLEIYNKFLSEARTTGLRSITFTGGGEPLMNPVFNMMARSALKNGIEIGLVTNGFMLDTVEDITHYKFVRVSLDASDAKTYKQLKNVDVFNSIISNIEWAVREGAFIGLSYVVNEDNKDGVIGARQLAEQLGVRYIQFKPAWEDGKVFKGFQEAVGEIDAKKIITNRYVATDILPCKIAGLIGVLAADGNFYYCCQHRGKKAYKLGSVKDKTFEENMRQRMGISPNVQKCPHCRYMNYAVKYRQLLEENKMNINHINFL